MNLKVKNHYNVEFFNEFTLDLRYDSVGSTFSFSLYFDPNNDVHRFLWQPGHYHVVSVEHNGELLIRGFVLSQSFNNSPTKKLSSISGYSLPGVLEDCQIPPSVYPLQFDGQTLAQITRHILGYFHQKNSPIKLVVDPIVSAEVNSVFDKTTANETQSVKDYLSSVASQKNVIMSHTPEGDLLYTKANTTKAPIFHFHKGLPSTSMELTFNGQPMHQTISLLKQASEDGGNAGDETIRNPYVPFVRRPKVKKQSSGTDNDTGNAARMALSEELKNITLKIETSIWEIDGLIIKPNNTITVTNDELYLPKRSKWFIESVSLKGNEKQNTAVLNCVLPQVYDDSKVENIFETMFSWRGFTKLSQPHD
jgi:prophage tail gpP-like protein